MDVYTVPIKSEYLVKCQDSTEQPSDLDPNVQENINTDTGPPTKKAKYRRGQNKKRPREQLAKYKNFCNKFLVDGSCSFGDKCKFSHNLASFLDSKPEDLGEQCPIFDARGFCSYGIMCRYAGGHRKDSNKKKSCDATLDEMNRLDVELRTRLEKRSYDWQQSEKILARALNSDTTPCRENRRPKKMTDRDWKNKLYLAPLTTVGNLPFRRVCVGFGAEITCGEMALATELLQGNKSEWALLRRHPSEKVFGVQLCGGYPDTMTKCAQVIADTCDVDFIDVNVGCPIDLMCQKGAGCSLMAKPKRLEQVVCAVGAVCDTLPLTLKMRTGVQQGKNLAHTLMPRLHGWGVDVCTVHGRCKEQRYSKAADWEYVAECAALAPAALPVLGCGDVLSYDEYFAHLSGDSRLHGVMLARGALIKPWLFTEIVERRHWDISATERLDILKRFVNFGLDHWGSDQKGVDTTRRFLLEWLSFLYRYVPVGLLERAPQRINHRPPAFCGRSDLETLMASKKCSDWVKISETLLGPVSADFRFLPKHKANAY